MAPMGKAAEASLVARFERRFFGGECIMAIGDGALGGKAAGLVAAHGILSASGVVGDVAPLEVAVPTSVVVATGVFDAFVERNGLRQVAAQAADDRSLAISFLRAELPSEHVGDLWALVREVRQPLAVRSSSLLEDALDHPLAGVYATKMTPNDAPDAEVRFRRLSDAIKLVYASTFFQGARRYLRASGLRPEDEKMAVVLQEVVGSRHGPRFYPDISGVARSWNYYPVGGARPDQGVLDLALGLGKTIVDGERCWTLSPARPHAPPPFASASDSLELTQASFWAVRMEAPPVFDPANEDEFLVRCELAEAEYDGILAPLASTYDADSDRLRPGIGAAGPRVLDFAPLLRSGEPSPVIRTVRLLLDTFAQHLGHAVEIEFAARLADATSGASVGFLQVRPMAGPGDSEELPEDALDDPDAVVASDRVLGHGSVEGLRDVVYVRPGGFEARHTREVAAEIAARNAALLEARREYLLIGFGRWGSSDPWLGIPVGWPDVSNARVVVEAACESLNVEMSQGAHFFHNLLGRRVAYFSVPLVGRARIDWDWLESLPVAHEGSRVRHVVADAALRVTVDGRHGRGVVLRQPTGERA